MYDYIQDLLLRDLSLCQPQLHVTHQGSRLIRCSRRRIMRAREEPNDGQSFGARGAI
jgi:hypothetical protein